MPSPPSFLGAKGQGVPAVGHVRPTYVVCYFELLIRELSAPTAKQNLAAVRMLYDWLVVGQVVQANPAAAVREPAHSVRRGKTPFLGPQEAQHLLDTIDVTELIGFRHRALIWQMVYFFFQVGDALGMRVWENYVQNRRL